MTIQDAVYVTIGHFQHNQNNLKDLKGSRH